MSAEEKEVSGGGEDGTSTQLSHNRLCQPEHRHHHHHRHYHHHYPCHQLKKKKKKWEFFNNKKRGSFIQPYYHPKCEIFGEHQKCLSDPKMQNIPFFCRRGCCQMSVLGRVMWKKF